MYTDNRILGQSLMHYADFQYSRLQLWQLFCLNYLPLANHLISQINIPCLNNELYSTYLIYFLCLLNQMFIKAISKY